MEIISSCLYYRPQIQKCSLMYFFFFLNSSVCLKSFEDVVMVDALRNLLGCLLKTKQKIAVFLNSWRGRSENHKRSGIQRHLLLNLIYSHPLTLLWRFIYFNIDNPI